MQSTMEPMVVLKKFAFMTAIGFAALVLAGPALALAGTLLPFFAVGCILYLIYQAIVLGPRIAFGMIRGCFSLAWKVVFGIPVAIVRTSWRIVPSFVKRFVGFIFAIPIWLAKSFGRGVQGVFQFIGAIFRFVFSVMGPAFAGAVVGCILGVIGGMEHHDAELRVPLGIGMGLLIGALAGAVRSKPVALKNESPVLVPAIQPDNQVMQVCRQC